MAALRESILAIDMALVAVMILKLIPALRSRRALFALGLLVCSGAYLAAWQIHALELPRAARLALLAAVVAQPVFFWLFTNELFDDRFRLRWYHALLIAGKFVLAGALVFNRPIVNIFTTFSPEAFPRLIPNFFYTLGFVAHALAVTLRTDRSDLVEPRRRLRRMLLAVAAALILHAILSAAVLRPAGFGMEADAVGLIAITVLLLASVAWGDQIWREIFPAPAAKIADAPEADPEIMHLAIEAMDKSELFRTEGLTVTALAAKLSVQEYKLRRAINGGLGYRNFNEYLNFYRMREAKKFLARKENADFPLIHLALQLGYPSPAPFNRAFKEATGMAPGEFRKKNSMAAAKNT